MFCCKYTQTYLCSENVQTFEVHIVHILYVWMEWYALSLRFLGYVTGRCLWTGTIIFEICVKNVLIDGSYRCLFLCLFNYIFINLFSFSTCVLCLNVVSFYVSCRCALQSDGQIWYFVWTHVWLHAFPSQRVFVVAQFQSVVVVFEKLLVFGIADL